MAEKSDDLTEGVLGCARCHAVLDGSESDLFEVTGLTYDELFDRALLFTHVYWRQAGML